MAQPVAFALSARDLFAMGAGCFFGRAARFPQRGDPGGISFQPAESIKQAAVGAGIDQRALIVLSVDLDQRLAQLLHDLHADRLIVDESAGAAVGELHAAQDHILLRGDVVSLEDRACRMVARQFEHRADLALFDALAHQSLVAARAQGQREGIE
jgi:hypothetical protein